MDHGLRDRNRAKTRVALVEALVPRLSERELEDIPVRELCEAAEISQPTFFNYFPTKPDLLTHFVQLWSLRMGVVALQSAQLGPLESIHAFYAASAEQVQEHPRVMLSLIAHQARWTQGTQTPPVELVERLLWLDDHPQAATVSDQGLGELLPLWITQAIQAGELPSDAPVMELTLAAASIFFGVPLLLAQSSPQAIGPMYRSQLETLWAGARARFG